METTDPADRLSAAAGFAAMSVIFAGPMLLELLFGTALPRSPRSHPMGNPFAWVRHFGGGSG